MALDGQTPPAVAMRTTVLVFRTESTNADETVVVVLVLHVVYGYRVTSKDDKYLSLAEECVDILSNRIASGGGIWPVDVFPFCKSFGDGSSIRI